MVSPSIPEATPRYWMTSPAHPETIVRWFLDLHHYWFDESFGPNAFTGMRETAAAYLARWVETGKLPPDITLLEIHLASKFSEWLDSSWVNKRPVDSTVEVDALVAALKLKQMADKGCRITHANYPRGTTCRTVQDFARINKSPYRYETKFRAEILAGEHLCDRCIAQAAIALVESPEKENI